MRKEALDLNDKVVIILEREGSKIKFLHNNNEFLVKDVIKLIGEDKVVYMDEDMFVANITMDEIFKLSIYYTFVIQ